MTTTISGSSGIVFPDLTTMQTGQQAVKAWVNFNGTGTVAIRAGYNVASITDNAVGDYTVNFTTAMPDTNYAAVGMTSAVIGSTVAIPVGGVTYATGFVRVRATSGSTFYDGDFVSVFIFR